MGRGKSKGKGKRKNAKPAKVSSAPVASEKPAPVPADVASLAADKKLKREAQQAIASGETPTRAQHRGWKRYDAEVRLRAFAEDVATVPKKTYQQWTGRQWTTLAKQADRYGIPTVGATIDVPAVVRWFHDLLAKHGGRLVAPAPDDPLLFEESDSPALERLRMANAETMELKLAQLREQLVPVSAMLEVFTGAAALLRGAGDRLQKEHGAEAFAIFCEGLDDAEAHVDLYFAAIDTGGDAS